MEKLNIEPKFVLNNDVKIPIIRIVTYKAKEGGEIIHE